DITDEGLISINDNYSLGIQREYNNLAEIDNKFKELFEENKWSDNEDQLDIAELMPVSKQFVRSDGSKLIPLNSVLKNNFYNGSYILEFFDQEKDILDSVFNNEKEFEKAAAEIREVIPIDLSYIKDRVGNIIFQFPVTLLSYKNSGKENWNGSNLKIAWHPEVENKDEFSLIAKNEFDRNIMGFYSSKDSLKNKNYINTGNSKNSNEFIIYNQENNLITAHIVNSYLGENFKLSIEAGSGIRTIKCEEKKVEVEVKSLSKRTSKKSSNYFNHIKKRKYENEKKRLAQNLSIIQYGKNGVDDRKKALEDIIILIKKHGREGGYLWDPYSNHKDLMQTLYHCPYRNVSLKAITAYNKSSKRIHNNRLGIKNANLKRWIRREKAYFKYASNNLALNLEFRVRNNNYGWNFHDRFLLFPYLDGLHKPAVWSLGTSVNGLGKKHHILQKVNNPQIILDEFNELWNELIAAGDDTLVWCSKDD
ncbi:MAG: VPA1262 family N-terminal domain-containing protein, partial [Bacillota bacterium]